jgi:hypothetical protein
VKRQNQKLPVSNGNRISIIRNSTVFAPAFRRFGIYR